MSQVEIEKLKVEHEHQRNAEVFRSVITAGQGAIKSAFLLNGGAAVALLAFIAHLIQTSSEKVEVTDLSFCLLLFGWGTLAVAVASGFTYLTQFAYYSSEEQATKVGDGLNMISIMLVFASYGMFLWGLYATYRAFVTYG